MHTANWLGCRLAWAVPVLTTSMVVMSCTCQLAFHLPNAEHGVCVLALSLCRWWVPVAVPELKLEPYPHVKSYIDRLVALCELQQSRHRKWQWLIWPSVFQNLWCSAYHCHIMSYIQCLLCCGLSRTAKWVCLWTLAAGQLLAVRFINLRMCVAGWLPACRLKARPAFGIANQSPI
jgi:hypothetical protein